MYNTLIKVGTTSYRQIVNEKVMFLLLLSGSEDDDSGVFLGPRDQQNNGI